MVNKIRVRHHKFQVEKGTVLCEVLEIEGTIVLTLLLCNFMTPHVLLRRSYFFHDPDPTHRDTPFIWHLRVGRKVGRTTPFPFYMFRKRQKEFKMEEEEWMNGWIKGRRKPTKKRLNKRKEVKEEQKTK